MKESTYAKSGLIQLPEHPKICLESPACSIMVLRRLAAIVNIFFRELPVSSRSDSLAPPAYQRLFGLLLVQLQVAGFPVTDDGDSVIEHWWPPLARCGRATCPGDV